VHYSTEANREHFIVCELIQILGHSSWQSTLLVIVSLPAIRPVGHPTVPSVPVAICVTIILDEHPLHPRTTTSDFLHRSLRFIPTPAA
jgi:hypothetical protein